MFVRFGKLCVIVTLVATLGAQWALLQTVAWTTMLANNLQSHSLTEAVADTFDGRHLCPLCKALAAAKKAEKKTGAVSRGQKFQCPPAAEPIVLAAPAAPRFSSRLNFY